MRLPARLAARVLSLGLLVAACAGPGREPVRTPAPIPAPPSPLRGLSAAEVEALKAGDGAGAARAAELNGYPGPKHVIELADSLALSPEQRAGVEASRARMLATARPLGAEIIAGEAGLEAAFREGAMGAEELGRRVRALAELRGRLRLAHLEAHLETAALLTPEQRQRYQHLRGHGEGHH